MPFKPVGSDANSKIVSELYSPVGVGITTISAGDTFSFLQVCDSEEIKFGSTASRFTHHCFCTITVNANTVKNANNLSVIREIVWPHTSLFISFSNTLLNRNGKSINIKACLVFDLELRVGEHLTFHHY